MLNPRRPVRRESKPAVVGLDGQQSREFLYHHLRNANLQQQGNINSNANDLRFNSNAEFWRSILDRVPGERNRIGLRWVELVGFQIVDWFPRTPGLYHMRDAKYAREEAEKYVHEQNGIVFYEPRGKMHMMEGGLGSIRFRPINLMGNEFWLCTATSDNHCHSGVPVAIPNELFNDIDFAFYRLSKITGQVRFLPDFLEEHFGHWRRIPQIYIEVDSISPLAKEKIPSAKVTPMIFFSAGREMQLRGTENVTYVTYRADSLSEANEAVEWLEWYVDKYGGDILTNFDQQQPTFANAPFSLQHVMSGRLNTRTLEHYRIESANIVVETIENLHAEAMNMTKINVKLGDGTTIHGDFVVANSIKDSFNRVDKASVSDELKDVLKELAKAVANMSEKLPTDTAQQVARDLETLTSEVTSKSPRKQWWQLSVEGLTKAAKDIGEVGKPVLELVTKIVAILSAGNIA